MPLSQVLILLGLAAIAFGVVCGLILVMQQFRTVDRSLVTAEDRTSTSGEEALSVGERLRSVALDRMQNGYRPDGDTQFERRLLVDGIAMRFQAAGSSMPDSFRELLGFLTVDELREAIELLS
ncbi:MAG: hypothetical protein IJO71_07995 [Microbacterium sp.]|uniref:hypothetical protein n=1 Tax=Microbacterium sp. TaxID=51671 RepID=UPI0025D9D48C|nr:hypothetical protein [Microbacterium sp.]MBQ9917125.1 hypothetical protein [Microbacterium sp.]